MKVLVVGGGGREHAVVWKLKAEGHAIWCAPGNAGIAQDAVCVPIKATDVEGMVAFAQQEGFDLVVVTPDDPLALGMVDAMQAKGIQAFGPNAAAAQIEASKAFSKTLMEKYGIPTASFAVFSEYEQALAYTEQQTYPLVVKADGLALGKGVYICKTAEEAKQALQEMMLDKTFGNAGNRVVIEEFMTGPEVSLLCFCDGEAVSLMPAAQDHKRVFDHDEGPNTGGMGAFAPTPAFTEDVKAVVMETIVYPTVKAMAAEGRPFKGVLYYGLMLTPNGPRVLEYNSRFGDPETQAILPLMRSSLYDAMVATINGTLAQTKVEWFDGAAAVVVMASGGYPGKYETGKPITGIEKAREKGAQVFHAGTANKEGVLVTAGGRVLGVTARGESLNGAINAAYEAVADVSFEGAHYRRDIGRK